MRDLPKVSINIPTYGQAHCIERTIESALAQDYPNLEIVVADDCSPDNTPEIVEKYKTDARFRYYRNESNLGRVRNYKKCLEEYASGEWVVNCDGDDYYIENSFVSEVMETILQYEDKPIVFAQGGKIKQYADREEYSLPEIEQPVMVMPGTDYFFRSKDHNFFAHVSTIYRRDIAKSLDFYRFDILSTDRESFLRLALHGDVILVKKPYAKWTGHDDNFSRRTDLSTILANLSFIEGPYTYAKTKGLNQEKLDEWHKTITINFYTGWMDRIVSNNPHKMTRISLLQDILSYLKKHSPSYLLCKEIWVKFVKAYIKAVIR